MSRNFYDFFVVLGGFSFGLVVVGVVLVMWFEGLLDDVNAACFVVAFDCFVAFGLALVPVDLAPFLEVGVLLYGGLFVVERAVVLGEVLVVYFVDVDLIVVGIVVVGVWWMVVEVYCTEYWFVELRRAVVLVFDWVDALVLLIILGYRVAG